MIMHVFLRITSLYNWKFCFKGHTRRYEHLLCYLQELWSICILSILIFNSEHVSKCLSFVLIWHLHLVLQSPSILYTKMVINVYSYLHRFVNWATCEQIFRYTENFFACLFSVHNTISLSHREQVRIVESGEEKLNNQRTEVLANLH